MQEYWFCSVCSSMNRSDARQCYKCRAPQEQATLATIAERKQGVVVTPGLDDDNREIASLLMQSNTYVSAWRLGYLTAGLMTVALAVWTFNTVLFAIYVAYGLISPERQAALDAFSSNPTFTLILSVIGLSLPISIVLHSVFLALTSMNSPALGSGSPRFGPVRAGLWWIENFAWMWWGIFCFNIWPYFIGRVFGIGGPIAAIGKAPRLLQDLMDRLGVPGSSDTRLVGHWSMAWGTLVGTFYLLILGPLLLVLALFFLLFTSGLVGVKRTPPSESQITLFLVLLVVFIGVVIFVAYGACMYLMTRITFELSRRQRIREAWVRSGTGPSIPGSWTPLASTPPAPLAPQPGLDSQPGDPAPGPAPQPAPQPNVAPPQPAPQPNVDEPVSWARKVGRLAPQTVFEPLPPDELPAAWRQAVQKPVPSTPDQPDSVPSTPDAASTSAAVPVSDVAEAADRPADPAADKPVIRPSSSTLSRYRAPGDLRPAEPIEGPPSDLDIGGGI